MKTFNTKTVSSDNAVYQGAKSLNYFMLTVEVNDSNIDNKYGLPGQFYELALPDNDIFRLRIPISIYDIKEHDNEIPTTQISFLVKLIGQGTRKLSELKLGDNLNLLGPLGNSFTASNFKKFLFITGGCGYAPLFFFKKQLQLNNINNDIELFWIHGGRDKNEIFESDVICTEDGSVGYKGNVIPQLEKFLLDFESKYNLSNLKIISCGPKPMLKAIIDICKTKNISIDVSLEEYMACGVGVCYGCAVKVKQMINNTENSTYLRVCKDGPVFNGHNIIFDDND